MLVYLDDKILWHNLICQSPPVLESLVETGIHPSKLRILGCHLTYSLSEEKRTTTLYIMEYNQAVDGDFVEVPIDDVMNRFVYYSYVHRNAALCDFFS